MLLECSLACSFAIERNRMFLGILGPGPIREYLDVSLRLSLLVSHLAVDVCGVEGADPSRAEWVGVFEDSRSAVIP